MGSEHQLSAVAKAIGDELSLAEIISREVFSAIEEFQVGLVYRIANSDNWFVSFTTDALVELANAIKSKVTKQLLVMLSPLLIKVATINVPVTFALLITTTVISYFGECLTDKRKIARDIDCIVESATALKCQIRLAQQAIDRHIETGSTESMGELIAYLSGAKSDTQYLKGKFIGQGEVGEILRNMGNSLNWCLSKVAETEVFDKCWLNSR